MIVLTRVDNRLIHGQILQGWLPSLKVEEVLVVSKEASKSVLMQKMMRLSLPNGYGLSVLEPASVETFLEQKKENRIFVIIEDLQTLKELLDFGFVVSNITLGNTEFKSGKKQVSPGVFLSEQEKVLLTQIKEKNKISFEIRSLPSSFSIKI